MSSVFILPLSFPWFVLEKEKSRRSENHELGIQFRDAMMAVSTAQKAGYSIENSFHEAKADMILLYGRRAPICRELSRIEQGIKNNVTVETMIRQLGKRTDNKDIEEFAGVFAVAKRSGGNMTETIERCVEVISEKMEVESEIEVLIAAKKMEARIMEIVPFGIMAYVGLTNPGFFEPLYGNLFGVCVMTACLFIYIFAYLLSEKIVTIEI
ncbi:type II secretion system F family protein [Butyrivibrio sp. NC2002]|uniref:type II secretion system F family protein n=1 Tax=Butyrivibrio sp. NC2002 TaxID=1410610 RepID=UPI00068F9FF5|nr:type II secretion system F family protein [Butyrivibrio sp. NC2002]